MKNYSFAFVFLFVLAMACSDDDKTSPDRTAILTGTKWQMVSVVKDGKSQTTSECFQENEFTFDDDGTFAVESECVTIAGSDPEWEFQDGQSKFKWNYDTFLPSSVVYDIIKLDATAFEIEADDGDQAIRFEAID